MPKIPVISVREFIHRLERYGCVLVSVKGSHHKVQNPKTNKVSIVSVHAGKDLSKGAFAGTLQQLGIDINNFLDAT
jgi:predicted RNA binding protein YcfA (HicA-like mRNA interferase family)